VCIVKMIVDFLKNLLKKIEDKTIEQWETDLILKLMCEHEHHVEDKEMDDMSCYALGWYIYKLKKDIE
jgi:hypothetical protein